MATIRIDGTVHEVDPRDNLLEAALKLGYDLPYFCWHEALGSVGACRQCAVKVFRSEDDARGTIQMACMVPARDGTRLSIADAEATEARRANIEFLMVNHPHDCPVCDEGGECHLQDMTVMSGHAYRAYRFRKRTFPNQDLGPFIHHEMNRCIQCYRCVRFYVDYADGRDFAAFGIHDHVWFGRHEPGALESPFAGNLVEVCPTGVFTDKTQRRHYARKWDLTQAPSVCTGCGVGCNTFPGERYGTLRRIRNRYNAQVNGWFLCDRGRFGYEYVDAPERIRRPVRDGVEVDVDALRGLLDGATRVVGIGSPRASLEDNFALRELVGPENFHVGIADTERDLLDTVLNVLRRGPAPSATLPELERADAVLILGEDVTSTAARTALALRRAARTAPVEEAVEGLKLERWNDRGIRDAAGPRTGPFFVATSTPTALDELATDRLLAAPDDVARFGWAVAHALSGVSPKVDLDRELTARATQVADALRRARRPVVVSGTGSGSRAVLEAAAAVAWALRRADRDARLALVVPECNSLGLAMMSGRPLGQALEAADGAVTVVLGDLYRRAPAAVVDAWFDRTGTVVALDCVRTRTTDRAHVVLPLATFAESTGTFVNGEGRAQRFFAVHAPQDAPIRSAWRWLQILSSRAPRRDGLDAVLADLAATLPALARAVDAAPSAATRTHGLRSPRQTHRFSGRTALHADRTLREPKPPSDPDGPFAYSMEGARSVRAALRAFVHEPRWNSEQIAYRQRGREGATGPTGVRLLEPPEVPVDAWPGEPPPPFRAPASGFLLVEVREVFGTEELSALAPGIAARAPSPYVLLAPEDARALGLSAGDPVRVEVGGVAIEAPARLVPGTPRGVAALPRGLRALAPVWGLPLPAPAALARGRP